MSNALEKNISGITVTNMLFAKMNDTDAFAEEICTKYRNGDKC